MKKFWNSASIRFRMSAFYTVVLTLVLVLYSILVFFMVSHALLENLDSQLHEDFEMAVAALAFDERGNLDLVVNQHFNGTASRDEPRWLEVWDENGNTRLYPDRAQLPPLSKELSAVRKDQCRDRFSEPTRVKDDQFGIVRIYCAPFSSGTRPVLIRVGRSEAEVREELREIFLIMGFVLPFTVITAAAGGSYLTRKALAPVDQMTERAAAITAEKLDERLPVQNPCDELGRLAIVFNEMFSRLSRSFESMRRFTADASHELRTPLTNMISVGEVGLLKNREADNYRDIINSMLEDARLMSGLVSSLLMLSRADADQILLKRKPEDLVGMARDAAERLKNVAAQKSQIVTVDAPEPVSAPVDRLILEHALVNLVENALKYSATGSKVLIRVAERGGSALLEVKDQGIGIPQDQIDRVFDRFYRIDQARSRQTGGSGLGLAIVKWAVECHQGQIEVESSEGIGSTFRILLPKGGLGVAPEH